MSNSDRRTFLKLIGSGALVSALPLNIKRALAIPANNSLLYFLNYQNAKQGSALYEGALKGTDILNDYQRDPKWLLDDFKKDVEKGKLPQVPYIAAPEAYSEWFGFSRVPMLVISPWTKGSQPTNGKSRLNVKAIYENFWRF